MFRKEHKTSQMEDVNWAPWSEVILPGTPKLDIQPVMRALAQSAAEMEIRGTASGQCEVRSRMVNRKVKPLELGIDSTRLWTWQGQEPEEQQNEPADEPYFSG